MKRRNWKRQHKWFGLTICFFMLMFCASGIILNHRSMVAHADINRKWLPSRYEYQGWNGGLLRGTMRIDHHILIYGNNGLWLTDSTASTFSDFNQGLPVGSDHRQIKNVAKSKNGSLFAVSPFGLYHRNRQHPWQTIPVPLDEAERLTDITLQGDSLIVLGRSYAYLALPPYNTFKRISLQAPADYNSHVSAFRTVWLLHSGELFGAIGKLIVDAIAIILILLCLTGISYWLLPKLIKRGWKWGQALKWSYLLHDKMGRYTIILTLLLCLTGWCLRPPMMVPLALSKVPAIPCTILQSDNAWHDKLRMMRYDEACHEWLISTSEGFYSLPTLTTVPKKLAATPPVSVMGLNVWQKDPQGRWLCGSFSGMFVWDRMGNTSTDYHTHRPVAAKKGAPFGSIAVSGYSQDFLGGKPFVVAYDKGTQAIPQPEAFRQLPMSLWNVALEIHSGRIYMGNLVTYIFIFLAGLVAIYCLWSGYKTRT